MGKPFFRYEYKGFHGCESVCNLEIHQNLVIITEREDNEGTSITNMAEQLATAICDEFDINPHNLIWIEHYRAGFPSIERSQSTRKDGAHAVDASAPSFHSDVSGRLRETYNLVFFNLSGSRIFPPVEVQEFSNPRWVSISKSVVDALIDTHKTTTEPEERV